VIVDEDIKNYFALLKPRVMSLVVFTGLCGYLLASKSYSIVQLLVSVLCIALASGASGAINMWWEAELDKKMARTQNRPLPAGKIRREDAFEFGVFIGIAAIFLMCFGTNFLAGFYLLTAMLFYIFIYTIWLKPRTPQNIVIGGAAGSFPPLIGWVANTGHLGVEAVVMFILIFLWTPPHFWALSLYAAKDYANAGIPMYPVVHGVDKTKKQILLYSVILVAFSATPYFIGWLGMLYLVSAAMLGAVFLYHAILVYKNPVKDTAKPMFLYSMLYLFLLFFTMVVDHLFV
jgi:heme o synthase